MMQQHNENKFYSVIKYYFISITLMNTYQLYKEIIKLVHVTLFIRIHYHFT